MDYTYKVGDKVKLLGTKEGKTDNKWYEYFEDNGKYKGDIVVIDSIDDNEMIEGVYYFVKKEGIDCTDGKLLSCDFELNSK